MGFLFILSEWGRIYLNAENSLALPLGRVTAGTAGNPVEKGIMQGLENFERLSNLLNDFKR